MPFAMPFPLAPSRKARRLAAFGLGVLVLAALWFSGLPGLIYYKTAMALAAENGANSLGLHRYRATVQGQSIAGLTNDISGLTYSEATGTLFAVINRPPQIAELSTDGRLLRLIPAQGFSDPEGITHAGGERFILSDEETQSLHWIAIGPHTKTVTADGDRLRLDIGAAQNMGFEGLSWDSARSRLYVTQEMFPARVITIDGVAATAAGGGLRLDIDEWKPKGLAGMFMLDLSSASLHEGSGNLILLSHMSSMLVEHGPDGAVLSALPLWKGMHGLNSSIGQAEGVAFGPEGDIFIVAEPNLFYRFAREDRLAAR